MSHAIVDFIYNTPTWLWGSVLMFVFVGSACTALYVFHSLVHLELRKAHNELAGFTVAIISVVYAVLLAFIAIATWQSYTEAQELVQREADYVDSIYRDTIGLPPEVGRQIRDDLQHYISAVANIEWPVQQSGRISTAGSDALRKLHATLVTMQPSNLGQSVMEAEVLKTLNDLYRARASRLSAVEGHVPYVIWWIIFLGGALTVSYTFLFGFHNFRMHLVMTSAVVAALGLVVVLIIALDWPFRGEVSVSPKAFLEVQQGWLDLPAQK